MKCLLKYQWIKLPRNQLPPGHMGSPGFQGRLPKWEGNLLRLYQRSDGWNLGWRYCRP